MQTRSPNIRSPQSNRNSALNPPRKSPLKQSSQQPTLEQKTQRIVAESERVIANHLLYQKSASPAKLKPAALPVQRDLSPSSKTVRNLESTRPDHPTILRRQLRRSPTNIELSPNESAEKKKNRTSPRRFPVESQPLGLSRQPSYGTISTRTLLRHQKFPSFKQIGESTIQTAEASSIDTDLETITNFLLKNSPSSPKRENHPAFPIFKKKTARGLYQDTLTPRTFKEGTASKFQDSDMDDCLKTSPPIKNPNFRQTCLTNDNLFLDRNGVEDDKRKHSFDQLMLQKQDSELKLSDFSFGKCIGNGKFGQVYLARHKKSGIIVAIKKICKFTMREYKMEKQIIEQIKLQAFCNNPNILQLYGFFHDQLHIYLILEYAPDSTLFHYLHKSVARLSEKRVAQIMKQVVYAVHFLHQNSIAHRDIKPENILLSWGIAKLCDFGWSARVLEARKSYCGTFDYTPPEILERKEYDQSVDLWCLGVLLYELLTGTVPFGNSDKKASISKIINIDKEKLAYPCELSPAARNLIQSLVRKNPEQRLRPKEVLQHPFFNILKK